MWYQVQFLFPDKQFRETRLKEIPLLHPQGCRCDCSIHFSALKTFFNCMVSTWSKVYLIKRLITILEQECTPVGCLPTTAVAATRSQYPVGGISVWRGSLYGGCLCLEEVSVQRQFLFGGWSLVERGLCLERVSVWKDFLSGRGFLSGGVCVWRGCLSRRWRWNVNRMTHASENITFPCGQ